MSTARTPGAPNGFPSNGSVVPTAPKHRVSHPKATGKLRPFTDYMPAPEMRLPGQHWSKDADRNWTGAGVGCYHGTSHNGKAILCTGKACRFAPRDVGTRSASTKTAKQVHSDPIRAHLATIGYTGPITPAIRKLTLDAITFANQIAEYSAAA